jgi:hypothetical protein
MFKIVIFAEPGLKNTALTTAKCDKLVKLYCEHRKKAKKIYFLKGREREAEVGKNKRF